MNRRLLAALAVFVTLVSTSFCEDAVPTSWLAAWRQPANKDRPRLMVHGIDPQRATPEGMKYYVDLGLGGIVCNINYGKYIWQTDWRPNGATPGGSKSATESGQGNGAHKAMFRQPVPLEKDWQTLVAGVDACERLGMVVWLYDEDAYPSGSAGGQVLAENRAYEATLLAFDASRPEPFFLRPGYEHTHASNNFAYARRYINLIDDRAVACFIRKTHDAYWKRLQKYFGRTIEATFTDEPSLMAMNTGPLREDVRKQVPVIDPVDPNVPALPTAPWAYDIADRYRERYHQDLLGQRRSLFAGDTAEDRQMRRQFWALVADLTADRYFGQIQQWCGRHQIASSGHKLHEEPILSHVPLDGNGLKVLGRMDIPGMDMLSSHPGMVMESGWMTAAMPASAALLHGRRRMMTEISDFGEKMWGKGPASLEWMLAAAAWQATWGLTDFNLYYRPEDRPAAAFRAYCEFVGRLNAVLKPAEPIHDVLLYYPIYDLWAEYRPTAEPPTVKSQSPLVQKIISSFWALGQTLERHQIPFLLIDHEMLAATKVDDQGRMSIGGHDFSTLVLPDGVELPPPAARVVDRFRRNGGCVLADQEKTKVTASMLRDVVRPINGLLPASDKIAFGRFARDGHPIYLLVNVGETSYTGQLSAERKKTWSRMDPKSGTVEPVAADSQGRVPVQLSGCQAVLLVGSE